MSGYDCMSEAELTLWRGEGDYMTATVPCADCPAWFEAQAKAAGCCKRTHASPRLRAQWREAKARQRIRERSQ